MTGLTCMRATVGPLSLHFPSAVAVAGRLARRVRLALRGEHPGSFFDLRDLRAVNRLLTSADILPLVADPREAEADPLAAARFVLALLATTPRLRRSYPRALSDGPDGPFARWLRTDGARAVGLSPRGVENVQSAFEYGHQARGDKVYEVRDDVRAMFPLGLTPSQRGLYLEWFARCGRYEDPETDPVSILWALTALDEAPDRGLGTAYRMQPGWQERVPHGLTRFGWDELKQWVGVEYHLRSRWLRQATLCQYTRPWDELAFLFVARPDLYGSFPFAAARGGNTAAILAWVQAQRLPGVDPTWEAELAADLRDGLPNVPGVNVLGLFRYPSGLQQAVVGLIEGLAANSIRTALRDVPVRTTRDRRPRDGFDGLERFPLTIISTGLDIGCGDAYRIAGLHPQRDAYRIAVWWWELDRLPPEWLDRGREVDEIWAPTTFIAGALGSLGKPVYRMPPGVELPVFKRLPKVAVGLDAERFTFLFVFDMNSRMARKNPLALIRAFRIAFHPSERVDLVIKVSPQESHYTENWRTLRTAAAAAGVRLLDRGMSRGELLGLINAADAYVSLHRSEGFGLTMAEAMLMGKPTIATAYSGNLDFMTPDNSYLVDSVLVPVNAPEVTAPPGAVWAEPSVEHAAAQMREIVNHPDESRSRGLRAQADLRDQLSHRASGARMAVRLRTIGGDRP